MGSKTSNPKKVSPGRLTLLLTAVAIAFVVGRASAEDPNARLAYGSKTGLPSNCRALIAAAISGYLNKQYSAEESLTSINRNCGEFGSLWGNGD